jgi:hypothetical protein
VNAPPPDRLFTAAEANAALPQVRPAVADLRRAIAEVRASAPAVEAFAARAAATGGTQPSGDERAARNRFRVAEEAAGYALEQLHEIGVLVKDADRGLVDFPSLRDGEVVELCWLDGEPEVAHWHHVGAGFAGRQPLA